MKWALLADVHGNHDALERVLDDVDAWGDAQLVVAGDLVGYGAEPDRCVTTLRARGALCVCGNHEAMVLGDLGFDRCVHAGIRAALWTRGALSTSSLSWLAGLPRVRVLPPDLVVCHGAIDDAERYVASAAAAESELSALRSAGTGRVLVCGHTHRPTLFQHGGPWTIAAPGAVEAVARTSVVHVNPGSVGQSRTGDALARYARYDDDAATIEFRGLHYAHERAVAKMRAAGLVARVAHEAVPGRLRGRVEAWRTRAARRLAHTRVGRSLVRLGVP